MNFTELFSKLPTSTLQDWETAARKQLKGKPLESINVSYIEGVETAPFVAGTQTTSVGGGSQGWVQFSSFTADSEISGALLLEALNGGAQGIALSFQDLARISTELSEVRFDFISLKVNGLTIAHQERLVDLIPVAQHSQACVIVELAEDLQPADFKVLVDKIGDVKFLLSPKLEVGVATSFSAVKSAVKSVLSACETEEELLSTMSRLGVELVLSSDYLQNIIYSHALRLLFANMYHAFGAPEPLNRPYLFGRISPRAEEKSHETYLIDATARAVAGISGGLDALSISPYPDSDQFLAARRSRNIQNVLAIEGLLGLPLTAVAGAAFFEKAALDLVSSVWSDS